jgi:hypothetical protein
VAPEALEARLEAMSEKLDAIHRSLESDIGEVKGQLHSQDQRVSRAELRLAQLQGAGAALTFGMPFIAIAVNHLVGG